MTLETVVFPHEPFMKEWYYSTVVGTGTGTGGGGGGGGWRHDLLGNGSSMVECIGRGGEIRNWETSCSSMVHNLEELDVNNYSSPENNCTTKVVVSEQGANVGKRKRRRTKTCKNKEEVENQRMTHIAVERNRRKQMNEYLAVLRSLMPPSYVQRGDQASIVGGAINFVKELEQLLQSLEGQKQMKQRSASSTDLFITFPQSQSQNPISSSSSSHTAPISTVSVNEVVAENHSSIADIEVTLVESHANLKVFSRRKPRQLLKMVVGLQNLGLTTLHLNLTTIDQMVLYSFSVKVEDDCRLNSADEIATAVYRMMGKIQEESTYN